MHSIQVTGLLHHGLGQQAPAQPLAPALLATMVQNVLSNCFKYSTQRPALIGVRFRDGGLAVAVHDRGRGIAEEHLSKVFDNFSSKEIEMLEIKRATPEDAQAAFDIRLQAIRSQCMGAYTREQMMMWTRGRAEDGYSALMDKLFYLGWVRGEPVVTGMLDLDDNELGALFVLPAFIGRGYGKAMLDHLESIARERAIETVVLDATLNAAMFYRACGYVGDEQAMYHSPSGVELACIPMTKRLSI